MRVTKEPLLSTRARRTPPDSKKNGAVALPLALSLRLLQKQSWTTRRSSLQVSRNPFQRILEGRALSRPNGWGCFARGSIGYPHPEQDAPGTFEAMPFATNPDGTVASQIPFHCTMTKKTKNLRFQPKYPK